MTAENVAQCENLAVAQLKTFCQGIKAKHNKKVAAAGVPRREEEHEEQDGYNWKELHEQVDAQVAFSGKFSLMPVEDAPDSCDNEREK